MRQVESDSEPDFICIARKDGGCLVIKSRICNFAQDINRLTQDTYVV